jgi:hypothetical protein
MEQAEFTFVDVNAVAANTDAADFCKKLGERQAEESAKLAQYKVDKTLQFNTTTNGFFDAEEAESLLYQYVVDHKTVTDRTILPEMNPFTSNGVCAGRAIRRYAVEKKMLVRDAEAKVRKIIQTPLA